MHCEKCGSSDTEITKCRDCGQKSRVRCTNCSYSHCTDKYCSVISIKRKIRLLSGMALLLTLGTVISLFFALKTFSQSRKKPPGPTRIVRPTRRPPATPTAPTATPPATKPASPVPTPAPTAVAVATKPATGDDGGLDIEGFDVEGDDGKFDEKVEKAMADAKGKPYTKGGDSPETGFSFTGFPWWVYQQAGRPIPKSFKEMAALEKRLDTTDPDKLERGDLLFFAIHKDKNVRTPNFVGVYSKNGWFLCAHPKANKVAAASFKSAKSGSFWLKRFVYAVRVQKK